jgi:hypothetical protein
MTHLRNKHGLRAKQILQMEWGCGESEEMKYRMRLNRGERDA